MSLRMIDIVLPQEFKNETEKLIKGQNPLDFWDEEISEGQIKIKVLVSTESTEQIMDALKKRFNNVEGFRMILVAVEASVPRPDEKKKDEEKTEALSAQENKEKRSSRISREELYSDVDIMTRMSWIYVALMILASVVAAVGILRNNVVFIIGAMVIAPALGPNVALSLAATLGDADLTRRALKSIAMGTGVAFIFSAFIGLLFHVDPQIPELVSRTNVSFGDIALALAAGSAAVLSLSSGMVTALIGVMVAVALLPPLVTLGMLVGSGHWDLAIGALYLFLVNFICVNLAGVLTFLAQGIRPISWWKAHQAKKAARNAIILWTFFLALLVLLIFLSQQN